MGKDSIGPVDPSRDNSRCPAIMLAASRTARVMGRMRSLIVSMITINGIKGAGVPWGVRWVIRSFEYLIVEKVIIPSHKDEENERVYLKWLVGVKTCGSRPIVLFSKTIKSKEINMIRLE